MDGFWSDLFPKRLDSIPTFCSLSDTFDQEQVVCVRLDDEVAKVHIFESTADEVRGFSKTFASKKSLSICLELN